MTSRILIAILLAPVATFADSIDETIPEPWFKNGMTPAKDTCVAGIDSKVEEAGLPNLSLQCTEAAEGFVGIMQSFAADNYLGKRLEFSAQVKSEKIDKGWGGLWMRVDGRDRKITAFDNMQNRSITGTTDWSKHSVVLDISEEATDVSFGMLMSGSGQLWISDLRLEAVTRGTPTTDRKKLLEPGNLELKRSDGD